jgi:hypothetical protein
MPVMVAAAAVPFSPIIVLLLLLGEGGLRTAMAFVAGNATVRLLQGTLFGLTLGVASKAEAEEGSSYIASTLLLIMGILLLISAYKKWRKEEDSDDPPQWMTTIRGFSPLKAAGAGALYVLLSPKQWVLTLTAISIIGESELSMAADVGLYLLFMFVALVLALIPIVMYAITPQQAAKPLQALQAWLTQHNRVILIAVSLIFGVWFLVKGVTGLVG